MSLYVGIDYSMSSPAVCVCEGDFAYANCRFYFLTSVKKRTIKTEQYEGELHKDWTQLEERFNHIATWAVSKVPPGAKVAVEDYAYGAKGKVFEIGENTGILKHKLWSAGIDFSVVPPTVVKKTATGKGNADKSAMMAAFHQETGVDIQLLLGTKTENPASDLTDAYFLCKWIAKFSN